MSVPGDDELLRDLWARLSANSEAAQKALGEIAQQASARQARFSNMDAAVIADLLNRDPKLKAEVLALVQAPAPG